MFAFHEFCLETYLYILTEWPWVRISETIHRYIEIWFSGATSVVDILFKLTCRRQCKYICCICICRLLSHTTEVIILNGNQGLKRLAEEGNESLHSVQRRARSWGSRKVTLTLGDEDTFRYLNHKNNPICTNFKEINNFSV